MRKFLARLFYLLAGFFTFGFCLMLFGPKSAELVILQSFIVVSAVMLLVGLAISGFKNWMKITGIVVFTASLLSLILVVIFTLLNWIAAQKGLMPPGAGPMFSYLHGMIGALPLIILGYVLMKKGSARTS